MDLLKPVIEPSGPVFGDKDGPVGLELNQSLKVVQGLELEVGRHEDCQKKAASSFEISQPLL